MRRRRTREAYSRVCRWGNIAKHSLFCFNWKLKLWVSLARMSRGKLHNIWEENRMGLEMLPVKAFVWVCPYPLSTRQSVGCYYLLLLLRPCRLRKNSFHGYTSREAPEFGLQVNLVCGCFLSIVSFWLNLS